VKRAWLALAAFAALGLFTLVPRLALPGVTPAGQPQWALRANRFYKALSDGDLARTYLAPHPGLTVLWLAGAAQKLAGAETRPELVNAASYTICALATGILLLNTWLLWRLLRRDGTDDDGATTITTATAALLWATNPLLLAMTGLIGLDGVASFLVITCLLLAALYLRQGGRRRAAAAGVATGIAVATKATALPLLLAPPLLALAARRGERSARRGLVLTAATIAATALVVWALLPAAWLHPIDTFHRLLVGRSETSESLVTVALSRERRHFILGAMEEGGGLGYYPLHFAYRSTPLAVLGVVAGLLVPSWRRSRLVRETAIVSAIVLASIMFVSQRYWRYLAPNLALLDLLAALGLAAAASWAAARFGKRWLAWAPVAAVALQSLWVFGAYPYYEFRLNPLFGGLDVGSHVVQVGWGSGMEKAQAFLQSEAERLGRRVQWSGGFGFNLDRKGQEFDTRQTVALGDGFVPRADCHVHYIRHRYELQRRRPWEENRVVAHRVVWRGLELATVWCRPDRGFTATTIPAPPP
jgi:4-amino-4-deoxy-L-arabinose transferase-like glycosyltransferase